MTHLRAVMALFSNVANPSMESIVRCSNSSLGLGHTTSSKPSKHTIQPVVTKVKSQVGGLKTQYLVAKQGTLSWRTT